MAKWILDTESTDGFYHHMCSACESLANFYYEMEEDYDENYNGEWFSLGLRESDIKEFITDYCPNCGEKMDCTEALHRIYGCKKCIHYKISENGKREYSQECLNCASYPWSTSTKSKWELNNTNNN